MARILGDNLRPVYKKLRQFVAIFNHIIDRGIHPLLLREDGV